MKNFRRPAERQNKDQCDKENSERNDKENDKVSHLIHYLHTFTYCFNVKPPPAKKMDLRVDRMKSSMGENVNGEKYSEDLRTLQQEEIKNKPTKKTVRHLMKVTHEGTSLNNYVCTFRMHALHCRS